jgi:LacI family transcriptional regulator
MCSRCNVASPPQGGAKVKRPKPTIFDVAQRADVSVGTVSHVLNDSCKVSEARRLRVHQAIKELGYLPNSLAQGLRRQRSRLVGLCLPHTSSAYLAALIDVFEEIAASRGYEIMQVLSRNDPLTEIHRVRALLTHRVGGLILVPSFEPHQTCQLVTEAGVPLVIVDRPSDNARVDQVTFDNRAVMSEATRRLIALGHRRLLFVVRFPSLVITRQRIESLLEAAHAAPHPVAAEVLDCGEDEGVFARRLASVMARPEPPTGIIVSNSMIASWMIRVLRSLRIPCPEKVSLLTFDEPEWADLVTPKLSIVRQPTREIARRAWELLIRRMTDGFGEPERIELHASIELRESVGPAPASLLTLPEGEIQERQGREPKNKMKRRVRARMA